MATITKRGAAWFVQVRRKGFEPEYKTFSHKSDAVRWGREREARLDKRSPSEATQSAKATSLGDLLRRYVEEITPTKRSAETERMRLNKLMLAPICDVSLFDLTPRHVAEYRDHRTKTVKPGTIVRELSLIRNAIEIGRRDWGYAIVENPVDLVRRPRLANARDRRLNSGDLNRLEVAMRSCRNPLVGPFVRLAIETGLRRGELLRLEWRYIDLKSRTAHIPQTKTGNPRTIPLTDAALAILHKMSGREGAVFPITATSIKLAWNRARKRAGLPDLRLHDLRHEAISRFAEMGLTTVELAVISGHRDPRMLFRYAHLRPADLARKLAGRSWAKEIASFGHT